jgi:ParB-like nuclease domain
MSATTNDPYGMNSEEAVMVPLTAIIRREAWQVRLALTVGAVTRYAAIYKTGGAMEPVRLARIGEALVLIDGAHRIEARRRNGAKDVAAIITPMTEGAAQWASASANLTHGESLKRSELRAVFRHYMATGQHRNGRSKVKSLRDVVTDIPGVGSHVSIGKWMRADFPAIYAKHYAFNGGGAFVIPEKGKPQPSQRSLDFAAIAAHFQQVQALAKSLTSEADKRGVVRLGMAMLEAIAK